MKKPFWLAAGAMLLLIIGPFDYGSVLGQTPPPKSPDMMMRGKEVYEERCSVCHGARGNGQTPMAKILKPPPRDFTQPLAKWAFSHGDPMGMFKAIKEGIPDTAMVKIDLPDKDIWALVYVVMELNGAPK